MDLWIVGKRLDQETSAWEFMGVFDTEGAAVAACVADDCFVGPAVLNKALPWETQDEWPGAYYPKVTDVIR